MFAEKENLLLAGPQSHHPHLHHGPTGKGFAPKTPAGKAFPKTPMKIPLNDENGGIRMPMTVKKSAFANRDLRMGQTPGPANMKGGKMQVFQTPAPPVQTIKRRPLGSKSANGKASVKNIVTQKPAEMKIESVPARDWRDVPDSPEPYRRLAEPEMPSGPDDDFGPVPDYSYMKNKLMEGVWSYYTQEILDVATKQGIEWDREQEKEALAWKNGEDSPVKKSWMPLGEIKDLNTLGERKPAEPRLVTQTKMALNAMRPTASNSSKPSISTSKPPVSGARHVRTLSTAPSARATFSAQTKSSHARSLSTLTNGERASNTTIGYTAGRNTSRPTTSSSARSRPTTPGSRPGTSSSSIARATRPTSSTSTARTTRPISRSSKPVQKISAKNEADSDYDSELEMIKEFDRKISINANGALDLDEINVDPLVDDFFLEF